MAYIYEDVDGVEPVSDSFGEQVGNQHLYGWLDGCEATYSLADMTVDLAEGAILFDGERVAVTAATDAWTVVADGTNPRWSWLALASDGTPELVSGTAAAQPVVPELGDRVAVALLLVPAGEVVADNITYKLDKRVPTHADYQISETAESFVLDGRYKAFSALGPPSGQGYASADTVGLGFKLLLTGSGGAAGTNDDGSWVFSAGTSSGDDAGVIGPRVTAAQDFTIVARMPWPAGSAQANCRVLAAQGSAGSFANANQFIGFRTLTTGNIFGVCDASGVETTRDTGINPDGSEHTFMVQVLGGGTIVRFFVDGTQVGADVTTNITSQPLFIACGAESGGAGGSDLRVTDLFAWREV